MLQALKKPYPSAVKLLENYSNKESKLKAFDLAEVFGSTEKNKKALESTLKQIICTNGENDDIIKEIEPTEEKDLKIFNYFKDMKYKTLLENFMYNLEKKFIIDKETIHVPEFKTFHEVLDGLYNTKSDEVKKVRIENIETMTKIILDNFEYDWDAREPIKKAKKDESIVIEIKQINPLNSRNALRLENNNVQKEKGNKQNIGLIPNVGDYCTKKDSLDIQFGYRDFHKFLSDDEFKNLINNGKMDDDNNSMTDLGFGNNSWEEEGIRQYEKFRPTS